MREYQDLKQAFGPGRYEGQRWRGFYHHAILNIAVYRFLMAQ
jgi:SRSO17 transposase